MRNGWGRHPREHGKNTSTCRETGVSPHGRHPPGCGLHLQQKKGLGGWEAGTKIFGQLNRNNCIHDNMVKHACE